MKYCLIYIVLLFPVIPKCEAADANDPSAPWNRSIPRFQLERGPLALERTPQAGDYMEALGEQAGIWGDPAGTLESWAYPFKLFYDFSLSFSTDGDRRYIPGSQMVIKQIAAPHMAQIHLEDDSLDVMQTMFVPRHHPGGCILLEVNSSKDLKIKVRFRVSLAPMLMETTEKPQIRWDAATHQLIAFEKERSVELRIWSPLAVDHATESDGRELLLLDAPRRRTKKQFIPILFAASRPDAPAAADTLSRLSKKLPERYTEARSHYRELLRKAPKVKTPDPRVNRALSWSMVSLDQLRVKNPFIGYGLVSGYAPSGASTRPGFCWFFDEPTLTSWAYLRAGLASHVKESLSFLLRYQRSDGKMVHEITQSLPYYPDYFNKYKYAYIHSSSGTYFLAACGNYLRQTGDRMFIRTHWNGLKKMFEWCVRSSDKEDGLLRIAPTDWGSSESSFEVNVDTQMAGMWICALREMAYLADSMNDAPFSKRCRAIKEKAETAVDRKLWDRETDSYYWGLNRAERPLRSVVPHHSVSFWMQSLPDNRIGKVLERWASADMRTDWGVRSLAASDARFDPQGYQTGTVWPVWNAGVIISGFRLGRQVDAFRNFMSMVQLRSVSGLGPMPEVLDGKTYRLFKHGSPHQMFSEVAVQNGFYDGLLGLKIDLPESKLTLAPRLPAQWQELSVRDIPVGKDRFDVGISARPGIFLLDFQLNSSRTFDVTLNPLLPAGSVIKSVMLDQHSIAYTKQIINSAVIVQIKIPDCSGKHSIQIQHEGGIGFSVEDAPLKRGASSRNLRLIRSEYKNSIWNLTVEGLPDTVYPIIFHTRKKPSAITGGTLLEKQENSVRVGIHSPTDSRTIYDMYVRWNVSVTW